MSDLVLKTVPLDIARHAGGIRLTAAERAARVQAQIDRVHPVLDAIKQEEASVQRAVGDPKERARFNSRKAKARRHKLASQRAEAIASRSASSPPICGECLWGKT